MRTHKAFVLTLAVAVVSMGAVIWEQHRQIKALSQQLGKQSDQLARVSNRNAEQEIALKKANTELVEKTNQLSAQAAKFSALPTPSMGKADPTATTNASAPEGGVNVAIVKNWDKSNSDPDVEKTRNEHLRAQVQRKYGPLFRQLNLSPEAMEKFTNLLMDKKQTSVDVAVATVQQGNDPMNDTAGYGDVVSAEKKSIESEIAGLLGEQNYASYLAYGKMLGQVSTLNQVQQSFAAAGVQITPEQLTQLQQLMAKNNVGHLNQKIINQSQPFLDDQQRQVIQAVYKDQRTGAAVRKTPQNVVPQMAVPVTQTAK